jgi:hypothetical protein
VTRALEERVRGNLPQAISILDDAIRETPDAVRAHHLRGISRQDVGDLGGAEADLRKAIALKPSFAEAHMALGILLLITDRYEEAWPEYEWRTRQPGYADYANYPFGIPRWRGESLAGKRLLVHAEQGFGDTIQGVRFIELAARECAAVDLWCQPALVSVLQRAKGMGTAYGTLHERPTHDFHAPILDLAAHYLPSASSPRWFGPYLSPLEDRVARWAPELTSLPRPLVGIVWTGSKLFPNDWQRSMTPDLALSLSKRIGRNATLVNLQFGEPPPAGADWVDVGSRLLDWEDTLGVISHLDILLSVDTAIVHLAGAMEKPVWVMRAFSPEWRWGAKGETSPWYPSLTLLRQSALGDWNSVIDAVARRLGG